MALLKTDYKDYIAPSTGRKYKPTYNTDGTITFEDVTEYQQTGDQLGAAGINAITAAINRLTPVGTIITWSPVSGDSTDLSTAAKVAAYFGFGTWKQIKDKFLLSAGDTYAAGVTGGEATHALTASEMPAHSHGPKVNGERFACHAGTATVTGLGFSAGSNVDLTWETASVGGGAAHNNMPPYLTVYVWQRTA